jgi:hypothetical protein
VVFSLLGYFVTMIMVLTAAVGAMIGLFSFSTSEGIRHYPRPVLEHSRPLPERNITAPNSETRLFMSVPNTKDASPAKNIEANSVAAADEKADFKKSKPHKRKVLARQRNNYERPSYGNALGYAEEFRNGPQRPFSNW